MTAPLRWLAWGLAIIVPLSLLGGGLIYVKLLFGAIPLHFLVEPIRNALLSEFQGVDVSMTDAALHRSVSGGFEVRISDLRLASHRGDTAVRAAEALVGLDLSALWSGRVAADKIVLIGPRFVLSHEDAGMPAFAPAMSPRGAGSGEGTGQAPVTDGAIRIELARALAEAVSHLRTGGEAASQLRAFGVRNATLEIDNRGRRTVWSIVDMEVDLEHHRRRSVIQGHGQVAAGGLPFGVSFRLEESDKTQSLKLTSKVEGLSLPALARNVPHLGLLAALDAPVTAHGETELTSDGTVRRGRFDVELGRGSILPEALGGLAIGIDGGKLAILYDDATRSFVMEPSRVQLDGSWLRLQGALTQVAAAGNALRGWQLELASIDGALAKAPGRDAMRIDNLALRARIWPSSGASELLSLVFKAGGVDLEARGTMIGGDKRSARLDGRIGAMDVETIKAFWPSAFSSDLRRAVAERLVKGRLKEGSFRIFSGEGTAAAGLSLSLEAENLAVVPLPGLPPVTVPRALLTREGNRLEIAVPDAQLVTAPNRRVAVKGGSVVVTGLGTERPVAELTGRAQSTVATVTDLLARDAIDILQPGQVPPGTDGKVEAQWRATVPVTEGISLSDTKLDAKLRITDGRIPDVVGNHDVTGATFTIGASERAIDVKGELLLAGILAKASGQWILGESAERQSPIVVAARLDNADRRRLGLTIDDIVQGEVPLEVQFTPGIGEHGKVHVTADLTAAELSLDGLAWMKPPGRAARLAFEVARPRGSKTLELQGFRLSGDTITINGTVYLGPDGKPSSYRFPGFSLNVVSNMEVEGVRRSDKVWDVKARGKTFDGAAIMRSLYAVETARKPKSVSDEPMDLDARIDTVIGLNDTTVRQVHLRLRRRNDEIVGMELDGVLDGGKSIRARILPGQGRLVHVETPDAGQALKTIGFYTSMLGGKGDLWVDLEGRAAADRSGQIQVSRFRILGDPIVSELVQGTDDSRPAIAMGKQRPGRRVVREEIVFETLRGSFATGNGQVAIESLTAAGPLIGASVRGKMDFRNRSLSLGGTYVPLSGLNRVLAGIPIFGELLTGPRRDGVIGITFAVDGPMAKPNVIINPLSMVAPGVLREIFQMVPENPRVTPGERAPPLVGGGPRVRSSQPETARSQRQAPVQPQVLDGWSSQFRSMGDGR